MLQSPCLLPSDNAAQTHLRPSGHRDFLDGARAVAALWVVLSHLWIIPFGMGARSDRLGWLTDWALYSHFAVDIFIVLSGFCLILPVAREGRLKDGAFSFFLRRARRILPPFYLALIFSLIIALIIQALNHQALQVDPAALLANVFMVQDLFPKLNIFNGPFWSIAVEWRIYFLFPLLVLALPRFGKGRTLILAALAAGAATLALQRWHPEMLLACPWYLLLFTLGLCAGSLSVERAARAERLLCWAIGGFSLAVLAVLIHTHPITPEGGRDFGVFLPVMDPLAGAAAAAGLLRVSRSPQRCRLLCWRPLVTLGTFAYSLYLVHLPCLLLFRTLLIVAVPAWADPQRLILPLALTLPLVIGLARLFFLAFERPFINHRR